MKTEHAAYRARQGAFALAMRVMGGGKQQVERGEGALGRVRGHLRAWGVYRPLVVTTAGSVRRGMLEGLLSGMAEAGIEPAVFDGVMPDPTVECVEEAAALYRDSGCDAIVAFGGGSSLDCAKVAGARIARPDRTIPQMRGLLKVGRRIPPLVAIPTTAGTGSEVTAAAVVTETVGGTHVKYSVSDTHLVPRLAVLDPSLTVGLPPHITANTGMDALTHAVEAYTNLFASPLVRGNAVEAVRLIFANLPFAYADGSDLGAREGMLEASYQAGIAFTNNFVGYVHAIAHAVGALYGIAHGEACATVLPVVMRLYGQAAEKPLAELGRSIGLGGQDDAEAAGRFIDEIARLNEALGIPATLPGLLREDFATIAGRALAEANPTYPVPAIWGRAEMEMALEELLPR